MASHTMTPARRAALKKAQAASARKRRGKGKGKLAAANRQIGTRSRKRTALKYGAAIAAVGAYAYVNKRNIKEVTQPKSREAARHRVAVRQRVFRKYPELHPKSYRHLKTAFK